MKKIRSKMFSIIMITLIILSSTLCSFAQGDGQGDGSGGGQGNPVEVRSTSVSNGQSNVNLNPTIVINFSKNVINASVRSNNKSCFSMKDENGNSISLNIYMADDQVEPDKKRQIIVSPNNTLKEGTKYTLYISKQIKSKSGDNLASSKSISFKTKGTQQQSKPNVDNSDKSENSQDKTDTKPKDDTSKKEEKKDNKSDTKDNSKSDNKEDKDKAEANKEEKDEEKTVETNSDNNDDEKTVDIEVKESFNNKNTLIIGLIAVGVICIGVFIYLKKVKK